MPIPIKVAIIDDEESARKSLARLMKSAGIEAATFASAPEFLADPIRESMDCVLTDLRMPDLDGLKFQEQLSQVLPAVSIVFLTGQGSISSSVRAMKAGAVDFLEKTIGEDALMATIKDAAARSRRARVERAELEELLNRFAHLTARERQVFALVAGGLLNKQIGFDLGVAERTIKVHRRRVMDKMQATSVAELVRMADRLGVRTKDQPP
ncbi:MAG TPA: response regulator [Candidatus Binataceae bacterium]|jgi:FixJ family two-component response regulator|nr:response regulator [Candidatus Binataceae bacterium]